MHSWNEYPLEPVWINFQEKYLSSTIQQLPWKIKQINWETSSEPSWESFFWEKLRFSIEMQHYHPKWKANIQVSFIQELIWNTAVAFSNSLASFQFLPGCFFFFPGSLNFSNTSWRMVKMDLQQLKAKLQVSLGTDQFPPPPLLLLHWGLVCLFQLSNID